MEVIVDYNNLLETDRRKGLRYVAERIVTAIGPARIGDDNLVRLRLYDGWYELQSPTQRTSWCQRMPRAIRLTP